MADKQSENSVKAASPSVDSKKTAEEAKKEEGNKTSSNESTNTSK